MKSIIKLKNVSKFYYNKGIIATGFSKVNLEFKVGEFVAITGESGSGKSTLLNVISGLDTYEEGEMYINGEETSHFVEKDFENYRRKYIGNIFQNFNLVNSYTVYQNIELVLLLNGYKRKDIKNKVKEVINKVDLYKFRNTKVSKLSGGQKQRVAIARALAKDTPIIIADEPTGNLDSESSKSIIKLLHEISKDKLVIIVTHNFEQVEKYVTRKIKMHDGKVLEDKKFVDVIDDEPAKESFFKNIRLFSKIRLGIRNTFNIVPKFLLLLCVFLFVVSALMGEYALFKLAEAEEDNSGYNYIFLDASPKRVIIKKDDKTAFSDEDYEAIKKIKNVDYIVENDLLIDGRVTINSSDIWLYASVFTLDKIDKVDIGSMSQNDNEIIVECNEDNWELSKNFENIITKEFTYFNDYSGEPVDNIKLKIVGIKFNNDEWDEKIYVSQNLYDKFLKYYNESNSEKKVYFKGYYRYNNVKPSIYVPSGQAYVPEDYDYYCKKNNCAKEKPYVRFEISNLYYEDYKDFVVTKVFTSKNIKKLLGINSMDYSIYVNENDYFSLFDKGNYQSSIYVKDEKLLDSTINELNDMGIHTLKMKDALMKDNIVAVIQIFKTIVTIILVVVLFFISYFVIKIILKSRNVYYTTIRLLGGTLEVSKELLLIELLNVANIAYFTFILLLYLQKINIINFDFFNIVINNLELKEYILMYAILIITSSLISMRFAKKLFKRSVMVTLSEEV